MPADSVTAADIALARAEWQETVFAKRPRRVALLQLQARWSLRPIRLSVLRNHAVEPALGMTAPYLAFSGLVADIQVSGYDDALSAPPAIDADAHIVWLDPSRYVGASTSALEARLRALHSVLVGPMLLVDAPPQRLGAAAMNAMLRECARRLPDVHLFPFADVTEPLGAGAVETRTSAMPTHVSGAAALLAAQHLGLQWIPALVRPRLKAVIVDLDETIVGGVLSEDGVDGVRTGGAFAQVRARLMRLHEQGVLLALSTKNDRADVDALFMQRNELRPLRAAFAVVEAGWQEKAENVVRVAERLRIGLGSVLVVDDNPAEVAAMANALHEPWFVVARGPAMCERALTLHPGLLPLREDALGRLRAADLIAGEQREGDLQCAADPAAYLDSLRMQARFSMNAAGDLHRLSELSGKTNRFNTALARLTESDVASYMTASDRRVVSIRLCDRLSDSGLIGAVFARRDGDDVIIDEIAVSCRALGRSIEDSLLGAALTRLADDLRASSVVIPFTPGPCNTPAGEWLAASAEPHGGQGQYSYDVRSYAGGGSSRGPSVDVLWEEPDAERRTA